MKPLFLKKRLIAALCLSAIAPLSSASDDVIISEYVEGSSYNKAIELFNGTDESINLSDYSLQYFFNGNTTPGRTISLSGTIEPNGVFVIAQDRATPALRDLANQTDTSTSWFNGDDAVVLLKADTIIDSIGQVGTDPDSEWGSGDTSTKDNTLRRVVLEADANTTDSFDPSIQWVGFPTDTFDDIGLFSSETEDPEPELPQLVKIHDIQGEEDVSPLDGESVTVEAVVTADFQNSSELKGYFIQEENSDIDNSELTSEGIFVYDSIANVNAGDLIRVTGTVNEYYNMTQLKNVSVEIVSQGNSLPAASLVSLPFESSEYMERYEGMQVTLPQTLTVTENYELGRYGEFLLSSSGRLYVPTSVVSPGEQALSYQAQNDLNQILVDDHSNYQNPDPVIYPAPELTASNTLRSGYTTTNLTGVVNYSYGAYKIQPTVSPVFNQETNPRTEAPQELGGSLKVASFNVLNYFNGDGLGEGFPTSRGASSYEEFVRQRDKIINAITAIDADIIGLMEIENDGYGPNSAIADLVNGLNEKAGTAVYSFINPGVSVIGTDEIAVGLVYKNSSVQPMGAAKILDSSIDPEFIDTKNRPVLAQTFIDQSNNGIVTIAVNHLKSKGSDCEDLADPDLNDGQGNCNLTRTKAATALVNWLNTDPTDSEDSDYLIIGDLNSYAMEDPISAIKSAGYTDLIKQFTPDSSAYSYVYYGQSGYLDHALSSETLTDQVSGVTEWHINADEPKVLDYNLEYKSDNQDVILYSAEPYRASDHDPVVIGLDLAPTAKFTYVNDLSTENRRNAPGKSKRTVTVSIEVFDDLNQKVSGATVKGSWFSKKSSKDVSCVTDEQGICEVSLTTRKKVHPFGYRVDSITHERLEYDASLNNESVIKLIVKPKIKHFHR